MCYVCRSSSGLIAVFTVPKLCLGIFFVLGVLLITTSLASTRVSAGIITIFFVSILIKFISVIAIVLDVLYVDVVYYVPRSASGALLCKQVVIQMFVLVL